MTIAEILEKNKIDRMVEIERYNGRWRDGCFHFPDGSCGSFNQTEAYRGANGELRLRTVFVVEEKGQEYGAPFTTMQTSNFG